MASLADGATRLRDDPPSFIHPATTRGTQDQARLVGQLCQVPLAAAAWSAVRRSLLGFSIDIRISIKQKKNKLNIGTSRCCLERCPVLDYWLQY